MDELECCPKSNVSFNLYDINPADGLPVVRLHVQNFGGGLRLAGCGTASDPLRIVPPDHEDDVTTSIFQGDCISVTGDGSTRRPYVIKHTVGPHDHNVGEFAVDKLGHVIGKADVTTTNDCICINQIVSPDGSVVHSYDEKTKMLTLKAVAKASVVEDNVVKKAASKAIRLEGQRTCTVANLDNGLWHFVILPVGDASVAVDCGDQDNFCSNTPYIGIVEITKGSLTINTTFGMGGLIMSKCTSL